MMQDKRLFCIIVGRDNIGFYLKKAMSNNVLIIWNI